MQVRMTRAQMRQLDRELSEYMESMVEGMGRSERRRALEWYVTGLLLEGERKSIEPMAARLVEDEAQVDAMRQRLQASGRLPWHSWRTRWHGACASTSPWRMSPTGIVGSFATA